MIPPHNHKIITIIVMAATTIIVTPSPAFSTPCCSSKIVRWQHLPRAHTRGHWRRCLLPRPRSLPGDRSAARTTSRCGRPQIPPSGEPPRGRRARLRGSGRSRAAWKTLHGCRPGGVARSSGGGPGGSAPGEGTAPPQSALCSALPLGAGTNGLAAAEVICQAAPGGQARGRGRRGGRGGWAGGGSVCAAD